MLSSSSLPALSSCASFVRSSVSSFGFSKLVLRICSLLVRASLASGFGMPQAGQLAFFAKTSAHRNALDVGSWSEADPQVQTQANAVSSSFLLAYLFLHCSVAVNL